MLSLLPSEFAEAFIRLKGRPFTLEGYDFLRQPYDTSARGIIFKTARQVAKSTTVVNRLLTLACTIPSFAALYVAPTENHISVFSKQKLGPALKSPYISKHFFTQNKTDQVFYKQFTNGSDIILRSCFHDAESIRGISSDAVFIDEVQDILTENISVIEETYTRSDHKFTIYAGTPKSQQHATEYYWELSTKYEWLVKCRHCNFWNYMDESCIQPEGLSCSKCMKRINAQEDGEWVAFDTSGKSRLEGYRIPQLITNWVPWNLDDAIRMYGDTADERGTIIYKYRKYPRMRFYNECLGMPYDNALCPINMNDLIDACDPEMKIYETRKDSSILARMNLYAGIDWSTSVDSASYTMLTIGGFVPGGRFAVVYSKRYEGIESDLVPMLKHIVQKIRDFGVTVVGADWGSGADKNTLLREALRLDGTQVIEFNHSGTQKADINWSAKAKLFVVNRTRIMTEIFNKIKHKDIVFPRWSEMQNYLSDLLNIYTDYNEVLRTVFFNHPPNKPDDYMHALCFCHLVATVASQA